ncbi:MAG: sensor histidine kinase, partial [Verrucomicrobiae bacterium]|nr:sensor histidine kinase [Verrucomicrobiae bacterium]
AAEPSNPLLRRTVVLRFHYYRIYVDLWTTRAFADRSLTRWAWLVGGGGMGLSFLMTGLLWLQVRTGEQREQMLAELRQTNARLVAAYQERERLSRDLHDGSIQNLYAVGLHLQRVESLLAGNEGTIRLGLNEGRHLLDEAIAELRHLILMANPVPEHHGTIQGALEGLVDRLRKATAITFLLEVDPAAARLPPATSVELVHLVREAVSNALRHGAPTRVEIRLGQNAADREWQLEVRDDGRGFDPARANAHGRGLKNLAARAAVIGGHLCVESVPAVEKGTRIVVQFPD